MKKILLICLLLILFYPIRTSYAANDFKTGWWIDRDNRSSSIINTYATQNNTLVLLAGFVVSSSQTNTIKGYLDNANAKGMKVIVGINAGPVPTMSTTEFSTVVNALKSHPALYGWYIGDEPELTSDQSAIQSRHNALLNNPGYYKLSKQLDPNHPQLISFNQPYNEQQWKNQEVFYDTTDIIGIHSYPFWSTGGEFGTSEGRTVYDIWKRGLANSKSLNKEFIATAQGLGDGHGYPYKTPTVNELRYQVFTAIVLGIDKVMFWMDTWGESSGMLDLVKNRIAEIQSIGAEMNAGVTSDSRIGVSIADRNQLAYRYGVSGNRGVLLAVNIANRTLSGSTLSNVQFTLPTGTNISSVSVLNESGRSSLPVTNGKFTDSFKPFEVHMYAFTTTGISNPTTTQPTISQGTELTKLQVALLLHGIGKGGDNVNPATTGNINPIHPARQATVEIINANNQVVATKLGTVTYTSSSGDFRGLIDVGNITNGTYLLRMKVPQYLRKNISGIIQLQSGITNIIPLGVLVTGDTNNDNTISVLDYNMILDCFSDLGAPRNCVDANKKLMTDLTDDGKVNQFDYNLFLRELSVQSGQ